MNKTEYMNTLRAELEGLPSDVVETTMASYESQFLDAMVAGKTENEIAEKFPHPRLIAAQKRANVRFQNLKRDFSPGNIVGLFVALIGIVVFNFFMIIPAFIYGIFLFTAYISSLCIYGAGIVVLAASLSGVPEVQFKVPSHHYHVSSHEISDDAQWTRGGNVVVNVDEHGVTVDKDGVRQSGQAVTGIKEELQYVVHQSPTVSVRNHLGFRNIFAGLGLLFGGVALLLLCLTMTKWTFIGFKKYLLWNLSLLRAPAQVAA